MAAPTFYAERAALILAEEVVLGRESTLKRHKITTRTLQNYAKRLEADDELSRLFAAKKEILEKDWAARLPTAIQSAIGFLERAGKQADPKDPAAIHAVAGALKLLADVGIRKEILDTRLAGIRPRPGNAKAD